MNFSFLSLKRILFSSLYIFLFICIFAYAIIGGLLPVSTSSFLLSSIQDLSPYALSEKGLKDPLPSDFHTILLITSSDQRESHDMIVQGFMSVIKKDQIAKCTIEHIDSIQMQNNRYNYLTSLFSLFQSRYPTNPDLIVVNGDSAYQFMSHYHDSLFPSAPLLFNTLSVPDTSVFYQIPDLITGYSSFPTIARTIGVAQQINPQLTKIIVLTPQSLEGNQFTKEVMQITSRDPRLESIVVPPNQAPQELSALIQSFGTDAAVLLDDYHFYAEAGNRYSIKEILPEMSEQFSIPIYTVTNSYNEDGVLGGYQVDLFTVGKKMGTLADSLLLNNFSSVTPIGMELGTPVFHYERMQSLGISESTLPSGSVFVDKPGGTTELTPEMFTAIALIGLTLFAFIIILLLWGEMLRHANQEVSRQQDLQVDVVSKLTFGFYVRDVRNGMKYVLFNPKMEELTGEKVKDVLERTSSVFGTPVDKEELCIQTKSVTTSEIVLTHTDEPRFLYYNIHPIMKDGEVIRIQGNVLDITERRTWERKLYESLELFHSFFEKNLYAIAIYSPIQGEDSSLSDLCCIDVNPGFEKLFDVSKQDILGKTERVIFSTYHVDYDNELKFVTRSLRKKRTFHFENIKRGDIYTSGYYFMFGENDEYIGFTCSDTTRIAEFRQEDATLFGQIENTITEIITIRQEIATATKHIRELMSQEQGTMFGEMVVEQTYLIEDLLMQIDQGLIRSDKIQEFLRKHHGVIETKNEMVQ